jgi:hypothetical protein
MGSSIGGRTEIREQRSEVKNIGQKAFFSFQVSVISTSEQKLNAES